MSGRWTVEAALAEGRNCFGLARLLLALAVVVSHAGSVPTGRHTDEPLAVLTGFTLGEHAVNGFFAISGFLVAMSFVRRGWRDYALARALRILPGLVGAVLVVSLLLGAALTSLPLGSYFTSGKLWTFMAQVLTSLKSAGDLPGVFQDNPYRFAMGTVWTLKYEIYCYIGLGVAGVTGLLGRRNVVLAALIALFVAILALDAAAPQAGKAVQTSLRLPFLFAVGTALYLWRDRAVLDWRIVAALVAATVLAHGTFAYKALLFLTEAYGVLTLALGPGTRRLPEPSADLSYGIYLYGWPVQQALFALAPQWSAGLQLIVALVVTVVIAALSWFLIEKPALDLKARAFRWTAAR